MKNGAVQSQKAVTAYFPSQQLLPLGFAEKNGVITTLNVCFSNLCLQMDGSRTETIEPMFNVGSAMAQH